MTDEARIAIRQDINSRPITDFVSLEVSPKGGKNMYNCPICGSGNGPHRTGALRLYKDTNRVICFAQNCFTSQGEDTLGALRRIWNCNENCAMERAGYDLSDTNDVAYVPGQQITLPSAANSADSADYTELYKFYHETLMNSPEALEYLHARGIDDDSINRFQIGYCADWRHSKVADTIPGSKRIIIPRTQSTYLARTIDPITGQGSYSKIVQGRQKDLFNAECLQNAEYVFVCEGEFDAISLYQAGASSVVGIGSLTNFQFFFTEAKKHPRILYLLALDNDTSTPTSSNSGKNTQKQLYQLLSESGIDAVDLDTTSLYGGQKDANDAWTTDPNQFKAEIARVQFEAQNYLTSRKSAEDEALQKRNDCGMINDFLSIITSEQRPYEPIPTGIGSIDKALDGGFIRQTLVTLGAPPAMGKTAMAQWIMENIATTGQDVVYINLEMSRDQLLARSFARLAWSLTGVDISPLEVLRGYSWTPQQAETIKYVSTYYAKAIAPHFMYNPEGTGNHIDSLLAAMRSEVQRIKAMGRPEPIFCMDYLQLIESDTKDSIESTKDTVYRLKSFAKEYNTVIFCIIANNRVSNKSGVVDMESGRDSSAIEYSGDVMLGLSYTAIDDHEPLKDTDLVADGNSKKTYDLAAIREARKKALDEQRPIPDVCNRVSLKVMKSRFSEPGRRAKLIFDGRHSTYRPE